MREEKTEIYSVSRLNREIRMILESRFPSVWVEAEISNFKHHSSGHMYLTLKDETSQMTAVCFSRYNQGLKFQLKDGLQVIAFGKVSVYEPRGQYQFYIERLEPKGMGALQLAFLQLKEKLEKEGLFDLQHKKPIPKFPKAVGIITSPTGAAIRDILNVIGRRFRGTHVLLYPVRVQGEGAAVEIAEAVRRLNERGGLEVLIVGRGGGSLEDLWAFNEEIVARAIFESEIPVISAVGHEIDWTICDLVSDLRAPTPSAAAELVVQNREELETRLCDLETRIHHALQGRISRWKEILKRCSASYAFRQPLGLVEQFSEQLDESVRQLESYFKNFLDQKSNQFRHLTGKLEALSPLAILKRGYSMTFDENRVLIKSCRDAVPGDMIQTRLNDGVLHSKVMKILNKEE